MMAGQPILVASWTMRAPACCRQSRASRERIRIWMAFISWPVRLCSAAACSSSAATSPARGAVKCVAAGKKVTQTLFCSFPLRSLSSLERFCVGHRGARWRSSCAPLAQLVVRTSLLPRRPSNSLTCLILIMCQHCARLSLIVSHRMVFLDRYFR